jgi:hypothetical protein
LYSKNSELQLRPQNSTLSAKAMYSAMRLEMNLTQGAQPILVARHYSYPPPVCLSPVRSIRERHVLLQALPAMSPHSRIHRYCSVCTL